MIATQPGGRRRRQHDLDALAARERGGEERRFLIDPLARGVRDELREPPAPVEIGKRRAARARQPARVSRKASPGRLMQSSVTSGSSRAAAAARAASSSSAERRALRPHSRRHRGSRVSVCAPAKLIDGPEIQIARDEHLDAIALGLGDGRRDVDGALQDLAS